MVALGEPAAEQLNFPPSNNKITYDSSAPIPSNNTAGAKLSYYDQQKTHTTSAILIDIIL